MKHKRVPPIDYPLLLACIGGPLLVGIVGAFFTTPEIASWYAGLTKPSFSPPNWLFGPTWTLLYILQGVAFYIVITRSKRITHSIILFMVQLALNLLWSILFFGLHEIGLALWEMALLWIFILWTAYDFSHHSRLAARLMIPYLAWVSFALALNAGVVYLN